MYKEGQKVFYVDVTEGAIHGGWFIEATSDGIWIKVKGQSLNTFIYSDRVSQQIFNGIAEADTGLQTYKYKTKSHLLKNNHYINDILEKLKKSEGQLYIDIIGEILNEKS